MEVICEIGICNREKNARARERELFWGERVECRAKGKENRARCCARN